MQLSRSFCANPSVGFRRPILECAARHMESENLAFTGVQMNTVKCDEGVNSKLRSVALDLLRCIQIDLRYLIAGHSPAVVQAKAYIEAAVLRVFNFQSRVFERRIRETESKREERLDLLGIKPAITHQDPFREIRFSPGTIRTAFRMRRIVRNVLIQPFG